MDHGGKIVAMDSQAGLIFHQLGVLDGVSANAFASHSVRQALDYVMNALKKIFYAPDSGSSAVDAPVYRLYQHWSGIVLRFRGVRMLGADGPDYTTVLIERGETAESRRRRLMAQWGLSQREAEVLSLIADGKTGPEISILLRISHDTARKHTSRIFEKLGVETRVAAASVLREFA